MQSEQQKKEIETLETTLKSETEKLISLKHSIDEDTLLRASVKKTTFNNEREARFYQENAKRIDVGEIWAKLGDLSVDKLRAKREKVKSLKKALDAYEGFEPNTEALKRKIEELHKSRLLLDVSYDDELEL